jgi:CheY-like chemotaxis protein
VVQFSKLLVIAESSVFRKVMASVLRSHADQVLAASSMREGRQKIAEHADVSLVLSEAAMSDGSGFQLLEYVASLGGPKPGVILLAARYAEEEAERAVHMGAIGYLGKPISLPEIYRLWKETEGTLRETARRVRSLGQALLIDPHDGEASENGVSHLAWGIRNVSLTGAFLETKARLPMGTKLHLSLALGGPKGHVEAEVVRVQEPSWRSVGGVGIVFRDFGEGTKEMLSSYIDQAMSCSDKLTTPVLVRSGEASS